MGERKRIESDARWWGAVAGLMPALAIAILFGLSGSAATPTQVAWSLAIVGVISTTAGWLAGPLAASERRRLLVASLGYAIAIIALTVGLSVIQGIADAFSADGLDAVAILTAVIGRVAYALVTTLYLMIPAIIVGTVWSIATRWLTTRARSRSA